MNNPTGSGPRTRGERPHPDDRPERPGSRTRDRTPRDSSAPAARPARLTVLSGPSGVGKSTVVAEIQQSHPEVWLSVSVTTRAPRPGEVEGVDYRFVNDAEFARLVNDGEFLEWAEFAGNRYGTPRGPVDRRLAAGMPVLLQIDLQGARQVRAASPDALMVFLAPPSWEELVRRLVGRGTEAPEVVERRLAAARVELAAESEFDKTLVNSSVQSVCAELLTLMTADPPTS